VDAVHAVLHFALNRNLIGADVIFCSAYKFFGPHVGISIIRKGLFESLEPYKLVPAPTNTPDKLETGTQNHEGIAAIKPAIEFIENLGTGSTRRERIVSGYKAIEDHENELANRIRNGYLLFLKLHSIKLHRIYLKLLRLPSG